MIYLDHRYTEPDLRKKKAAQKKIRLQFRKKIFDARQKGDLEEVKKLEFLMGRV